jgi:hypothetical protein
MADSLPGLSITKDIINIICTLIQTFILGILVFWWNRRNRKQDKKEARQKADQDRKEAKRKEEADRQKADREKIIAILCENYDEVQEIFHDLKKSVDNLKERKINTGSRTFYTEYDVLQYMCHGNNWDKFNEPRLSKNNSDGREDIMFQVRRIMKFFKDFSFQLSAIDKTCPNDIKSEFSTEIIDMAKTIYPFMTKTRQKLIKKVVIYFGCANEGLLLYPGPGHDEIKQAIPYIEHFWYSNGEMNSNIECKYPNVKNLGRHVEDRIPEIIEIEAEICDKIGEILESTPQGDLLHLIRLMMLEIKNNFDKNNFDTEEKEKRFKQFCDYVRIVDCSLVYPDSRKLACEKKLHGIEGLVQHLKTKSALLKSAQTVHFLNSMEDIFEKFGKGKLEEDKLQAILVLGTVHH